MRILTKISDGAVQGVWKSLAGGVLIILVTAITYIPALRGGFVFDDDLLITGNRLVKANDGLYRFWFTTEAPDYYPLTWTLWWLEWRLWGNAAVGYHAVNVLLHGANAVLVWMILRRLKIAGGWLAALVFAIHPVNTATVAWISEQKNTLSMFFYGATILLYLQFDEDNRWRWYGLSLAAFLLALLSKSAVVMLPVVLLLCVWWSRGTIARRHFLCSVPFFLLSLTFGLVTVWFQNNRALAGYTAPADGLVARLIVAGWVPWHYLSKALLPVQLSVIYPNWNVHASRWLSWLPAIALVGALVLFWWQRKSWGHACLFGLGYFVVTLFPVMGFFRQGFYAYSPVADPWQYYSIIGVIALLVAGGAMICRRPFQVVTVGVVLITLAAATWRRAGVYQTNETLWRDTVTKNPAAWLAHYNLGNARSRVGDIRQAILCYEQALLLRPDYIDAHVNLGDALLRMGGVQDAINHYEQALRIQPGMADVHNNLAFALSQAGKTDEAIRHYEYALQLQPAFAAAHYNLGNVLLERRQIDNAITHYRQAVQLQPDHADGHNNLAFALLLKGKVREAIGHCQEALRIRPAFAEAHYNLANALLQEDRVQEAVNHYEEAIRRKPGFTEAEQQLARLRAVR